jgi:hypothetical protein
MATAVPAKPGKVNLGALPRIVRKKKPEVTLDDTEEARLRMSEGEYASFSKTFAGSAAMPVRGLLARR